MTVAVQTVRPWPARALAACALAGLVVMPARAEAQWYFVAGLGGNHTTPATVSIRQPAHDTSLDFQHVRFEAKPLTSPQYYDWHLGKLFGTARRLGVELEFIHLKVIADTTRAVRVTGTEAGAAVDEVALMSTRVQRYSMTHGLNFVLLNVVSRLPLGGSGSASRLALVVRAGAGATLPHAETNVFNEPKQLYQWAGAGYDAGAGVSVRLRGRWSAVVDYKVTHAKPRISLASGTGQTAALTHQVTVGLAFGLSR
jgi:opacity protein-like surface antigen